jgi:hypothetical protein
VIAVVRLRCSQRTRDYATRRSAEGKSKKEIIRCLKRYIVRQLYYTLRADLKILLRPLDTIRNLSGLGFKQFGLRHITRASHSNAFGVFAAFRASPPCWRTGSGTR